MVGMPAWRLDDIEFNTNQADKDGAFWIIEEEQGFWGSAGNANTYTAKLNQHGSYRIPGWKPKDTITLTCSTYIPSQRTNYAALRRAQMKAAALCSDPDRMYDLVCYSEIGPLVASVALDGDILTTPRYVHEPAFEWSIQLAAPDPRRYALDWSELQTGLPQDTATGLNFKTGTNGLDFVTTGGLAFGAGALSGSLILRNQGTAPTQPVLTLYGPLTTPTLTTATGSLRYNATLAAGEYVVIDPSDPSVLFGGTANRSFLVNPANFRAFTVPPKSSLTTGLSHDGVPTATGYVTVSYRSAWF